ncbi:MAG TPA: FG-GAP-like repeat-containing protein [Opitutaceae bacterium]|nr:FG-GAP-like repeat-containing protein [Opitutaceae bacterium]
MENRYDDPAGWAKLFREYNNGSLGTGVAVGDFDNDGNPDVLVSYKTEPCRLYRNLGDFRFEDVTEKAGLGDKTGTGMLASLLAVFSPESANAKSGVWNEGVAMADVNNDGWLDIYICRFRAQNLLYINQKNGTFREEAVTRGLAVVDSSVMAAFSDYDRDGQLDLLLQTNLLDASEQPSGRRNYLFHNRGGGFFDDVSALLQPNEASQGHSCFWWDFDEDGWPDLYIANDFQGPDRLYRNIKGTRFEEVSEDALPHTPFSSMGCDAADVDGDGHIDLFVADMAGRTHEKDQRTLAPARYSQKERAAGAARQVARNALFLATRTRHVREAAYLADLAASDWTWSVRFEDFDEDGWVDLYVTTGMNREHHNLDLIARSRDVASADEQILITKNSPVLAEANLAFRNQGNLHFVEVGKAWGLDDVGVSFGCATGDLDGDGDLDIVVSNYEKPPSIYRNNTTDGHRIIFALRGRESNRFGIGSIVRIQTQNGKQVAQLSCARGYQSTSEPVVHFGLGAAEIVERVEVLWPSGKLNVWENLPADRKYTLEEKASESAVARENHPQFVEHLPPGEEPRPRTKPLKISHRLMPWKIDPALMEAVNRDLAPILQKQVSSEETAARNVWARSNEAIGAVAAATLKPGGELIYFVGRRSLPGQYPKPASCSLLVKRGNNWSDEIDQLAPELKRVGNVTAALWSDFDNDGDLDLIVATEWGMVHCFRNGGGVNLTDVTEKLGFSSAGKGWWRSIAAADFNGDGFIDYAVGNIGLNTQYRASVSNPAVLYYNPNAGNGQTLIEAYYEDGVLFPWRSRGELCAQLPALGPAYPTHDTFAKATLESVLLATKLDTLPRVEVTELNSGVLLSGPDGVYRFVPLPRDVQISSAQAMVAGDFNGDGNVDIYIVQNSNEPTSPPWDGGLSQLLLGDGQGAFATAAAFESGLDVRGPGTAVEAFDENDDGWADLAVAQSDHPPRVFLNQGVENRASLAVHIDMRKDPGAYLGARIEYHEPGAKVQVAEVYSHCGYSSRSRAVVFFGRPSHSGAGTISVRWPDGTTRNYSVLPGQNSVSIAKR